MAGVHPRDGSRRQRGRTGLARRIGLVQRQHDGIGIAREEERHIHLAIVNEPELILIGRVGRIGEARHRQARRQRHRPIARRVRGLSDVRTDQDVRRRTNHVQTRAVAEQIWPIALEARVHRTDEVRRDRPILPHRIVKVVILQPIHHHPVIRRRPAASHDQQVTKKHRMPVATPELTDVIDAGHRVESHVAKLSQVSLLNVDVRIGIEVPQGIHIPRTRHAAPVVAHRHLSQRRNAIGASQFHQPTKIRHSNHLRQQQRFRLHRPVRVNAHVTEEPNIVRIRQSEVRRKPAHRVLRVLDVINSHLPV